MADYDEYCVIEESDEEDRRAESSEDELDIILHGTPKQKRRLRRSLSRGSLDLTDASSSGDEFEKEVEAELDATMKSLEEQHKSMGAHTLPESTQGASTSGTQGQGVNPAAPKEKPSLADEFYDDVYFDSDSENEDNDEDSAGSGKKKGKGKRRVLTNDELFYDPNIDDQNEEWMNKQRDFYKPKASGAGSGDAALKQKRNANQKPAATTDAVLNCPACMTLLCLDCQRHELYTHQYRAMFVVNCLVVRDEILRYKQQQRGGRSQKRKKHKAEFVRTTAGDGESSTAEEIYHPVKCGVCSTEVAVYDSDEVYHFHNVLTSAP